MEKQKMVYGLFVWDENEFSSIVAYKTEKKAEGEYARIRGEYSDCDVEEWDEIGGKTFRCGSAGIIVRLCVLEIDAGLLDDEGNLKSNAHVYGCADVECDKYEQIRQVKICGEDEAKDYIYSWYADQDNYFRRTVMRKQGLVPPPEEVKQLIAGGIENYNDYIESDYGRYGGYYAGVGVKRINALI